LETSWGIGSPELRELSSPKGGAKKGKRRGPTTHKVWIEGILGRETYLRGRDELGMDLNLYKGTGITIKK